MLETGHLDVEASIESLAKAEEDFGYNLILSDYRNLREDGVLDSVDVLAAAIEIAFLQAKTVLETSSWELLMNPNQLSWNRGGTF